MNLEKNYELWIMNYEWEAIAQAAIPAIIYKWKATIPHVSADSSS